MYFHSANVHGLGEQCYYRGVALGGEAGEEAFLRVSGGGFAFVFSEAGDEPGVALI